MKLSLIPKGNSPDAFELGATGIKVLSKANPRLETNTPYRSLSATYRVEGPRQKSRKDTIGRVFAFSLLPIVFIYYSVQVGWGLLIIAALTAIPLLFMISSLRRKPVTRITFSERGDGDLAFYTPYFPEEEQVVKDFVVEIQKRIRNENQGEIASIWWTEGRPS